MIDFRREIERIDSKKKQTQQGFQSLTHHHQRRAEGHKLQKPITSRKPAA
jgi:hypothetical protein